MKEINNLLASKNRDDSHYLKIGSLSENLYYKEFLEAAKILKQQLSQKAFEYWLKEKMLLKDIQFVEKTFIQYACEAAVVRYFAEHFKGNFQVEPKINPSNNKDVDCSISKSGYVFNVEVKCANYDARENIEEKDAFKYETIGRIPDRHKMIKELSLAIDEGSKKRGDPIKPHLEQKNMDNNLKDFLEDAHEKFNPKHSEDEVNILIIGCDDVHDIQNWWNYLFQEQGLFTNNPFADNTKYKLVDLVVFTNLYYKHHKYFQKTVKGSWSLENTFNLVFCNPFRILEKESAINCFLEFFNHYTWELSNYSVPGDAPTYVKDSVRIRWFVKEHLEEKKGIFLFEEKQ